MTDYTELAKTLRNCANDERCGECKYRGASLFSECIDRLMEHAADAIEELLPKTKQLPKWISVEERLPDDEVPVLVARKFLGVKNVPASTYVEIAYLSDGDWYADLDEYKISRGRHTAPYAWMPLPEPPEGT